MNKIVIILLLFIIGCTANIVKVKSPQAPKITVNQDDLETASTEAHHIEDHLTDYVNSDYARFEQPQIMAVAHDVYVVANEPDEAKFVQEVSTLVQDWQVLLATDNQFQQQTII